MSAGSLSKRAYAEEPLEEDLEEPGSDIVDRDGRCQTPSELRGGQRTVANQARTANVIGTSLSKPLTSGLGDVSDDQRYLNGGSL